ncbi:MAG: polysaccharide deacetylase family protein [Thermaerobacter sp.]|nr:polysaccharide deacetylase family protein [Thermaerobacter sp.]
MKPSYPLMLTALFGLFALTGCGVVAPGLAAAPPTPVPKTHHSAAKQKPRTPSPVTVPRPTSGNELGVVPILEYHMIGPTEGRWQRTPQGLYQDLTWLYDHGFALVTMQQYESGDMNLPAGKHPAVLTFDDGDYSQFEWNSAHVPLPTSAVGVLEAFQKAHPDFPVTATFYLNNHPFGVDSVAKMQWLVAHGFELGNHTYTHADMSSLDASGIEKEIGEEQAYIEQSVPGYVPVSFALPYGGLPQDPTDRTAVLNGSYQGISWHFLGVALVGANPAPSPYSKTFSVSIPRIQVVDPSLVASSTRYYILSGYEAQFLQDPSMLYTSDGSPKWISFPQNLSAQLNPAYSSRANPEQ